MGVIHHRARRLAEALACYERAREFAEPLATAHPDDTSFQLDLAAVLAEIGELNGAMGKPSEAQASFEKALVWFDRAMAFQRKALEADPSAYLNLSSLADTARRRGVVYRKCGRVAEAVADFRYSADLLGGLANPSDGDLYSLTCSLALLSDVADVSGSGLSAAEGRVEADRAMVALRRAVDAGWRDVSGARNDPDLDPIRSRPDFRLLMLDLGFPADPFARQTAPGGT